MEIIQIVGLGLVAAVLIVIVRQQRPDIAVQLSIAAGAILFLLLVSRISAVIDLLALLAQRSHVNTYYLGAILRIVGIAYVAEFGAQVARDAGEGAIAAKIEMGGKILIFLMALPVITAILDTLIRMLG